MKKEDRVQRAINVLSDKDDSIVVSFGGKNSISVKDMVEELEKNKIQLKSLYKNKYKFIIKNDYIGYNQSFYIQILKKGFFKYHYCFFEVKSSSFMNIVTKNISSFDEAFKKIEKLEHDEVMKKLNKKTFK